MFKLFNKSFSAIALISVFLMACSEEEGDPFKFQAQVVRDTYTMGGTPHLLFSTDNGVTYVEYPILSKGDKVKVKLNNGTRDLLADDFTFDWSESSPSPTNATGADAEFTIGAENKIKVKIVEKYSLVTGNRDDGSFYVVNTTTGATSGQFNFTLDDDVLTNIRSLVYDPNHAEFFAGSDGNNSELYVIDPSDGHATSFSAGSNIVADWQLDASGNLIAAGWFSVGGNWRGAIATFSTTSGARTSVSASLPACCGMGMVFDAENSELIMGNSNSSGDGEIIISKYEIGAVTAGVLDVTHLGDQSITNLIGFPAGDNIADTWLNVKQLEQIDGELFGILFNYAMSKSYLIKLDLDAGSATYISTLGADGSNVYNSLAYIPNHSF